MEVDVLKRVPVREQDPKVRATNFEEVCYGYNKEEAMAEASRCLNCKNAQCMKGCPVSINIPAFVEQVKNGDFTKAYEIISESSALPAVCGRVCRLIVDGKVKFACVDGPEFDGHLVDFDQAMKRQQQYKTEEGRAKLAYEEGATHHGGCGNCGGDK